MGLARIGLGEIVTGEVYVEMGLVYDRLGLVGPGY